MPGSAPAARALTFPLHHRPRGVGAAHRAGQRHGKPVVLAIAAGRMHRDGRRFFQSDNSVWLTDAVPVEYIEFGA